MNQIAYLLINKAQSRGRCLTTGPVHVQWEDYRLCKLKKMKVWLCWPGCWTSPTHRRDPTTALTCGLLAAQFPAWPVPAVLSRLGHRRFLSVNHVDARLSADTCSTQVTVQQLSQSQIIRFTRPPSRGITGDQWKITENMFMFKYKYIQKY